MPMCKSESTNHYRFAEKPIAILRYVHAVDTKNERRHHPLTRKIK